MAVDVQHRNCKVCNKVAMRINVGTYSKKTSKRYIGEDGKQWNGNLCPDCQRNRAKVNMRRLRDERKRPKQNDA